MRRVAFVADVHVGNPKRFGGPMAAGLNDRCRIAVETLGRACFEAREQGCEALFVLGDLFDGVAPGPRVVAAVQGALADSARAGLPVHVMPGNHDAVSTEPGDHALGPLAPVASVIDAPSLVGQADQRALVVGMVPHRPSSAAVWLPGVVAQVFGEHSEADWVAPSQASLVPFRVLAVHLGVAHPGTPAHLRTDPSAVSLDALDELCARHGIGAVVAGHWHEPFDARLPCGAVVSQVGALVPTGVSDAGVTRRGRMLILDASGDPLASGVEVPGPRFVRVSGPDGLPHAVDLAQHAPSGCRVFVEWQVAPEEVAFATQELRAAEARGDVYRGALAIDVEDANERARSAATAARSATTLDGALAAFVAEMDLPDGVDRRRVLAEARRYVGGAA